MKIILKMENMGQEEKEKDAEHVDQRQLGTVLSVYQKLPKELGIVIVYHAQGSINVMCREISAL